MAYIYLIKDLVVLTMNRLRDLREDNDLLLTDVAIKIGTSSMSISRYEREESALTPDLINKFCNLYNVSADYLLGRSPLMRMELTPEEESTVLALRRADDHTRDLVRLALEPYWQEGSSGTATQSA